MTPDWTAGVHRAVLPNGLRILIQPVDGSPAAAVVTRVAAGFFDEPDTWVGISHVLEHMFFKGTATRGVGDIARTTRFVGGYLNAATSYDYTQYYTVLPAHAVATAIDVQADALQRCRLDEEDLRSELRVIVEEARRKLDNPGAVAQETLHALLFDHHRIRRWRIGTEDGLRQLSHDDLLAYYTTRYTPARTVVAVVGGVDVQSALALCRRHYGGWKREAGPLDPGPPEPRRDGVRVRTLRGDVLEGHLVVGWRGVPTLDPDAIPLDLAAAVLALGRGSVLYRRVRESGLASSVGAWNYAPSEVGVFSMAAALEPERLPAVLAEMAASVETLRRHGPESQDLERARTLLRARWTRRFETAEGRAAELAAAEAIEDLGLLGREYARMLSTTAEEVRAAVARHLDPRRVAAVAHLPTLRGEDLTAEALEAAIQSAAGAPPTPVHLTALSPPPAVACSPTVVGAVLHAALEGADVLVRRRPGTPTAALGLYRIRGDADSPTRAGLAALAVRSAVRGAGGENSAVLAERFERLGGSLGIALGREHYGFTTTVLAEHTVTAALLLDRVMRHPRLLPEEVSTERSLLETDARQLADDMHRWPMHLARRAAFGPAGLGLPLLGLPETVSELTAEAVKEWHADRHAEGRRVLVAVGDFEPHRLLGQLAAIFTGDPPAKRVDPPEAQAWLSGPEVRQIVEPREKAQTAMSFLFDGPARRDAARYAADVWAAHAGGLGGKLFQALRDDHALAYTVSATVWRQRWGGGIATYIGTSPDREAEARDRMLEELHRFGERPPSEEDTAGAIAYLIGQGEVRRQSAAALREEIADAWLLGTGLEELVEPAAPYHKVTPDDLHRLAETYLVGRPYAEGVVRGGAVTF